MLTVSVCKEVSCGLPIKAHQMCRKHYNRWLAIRPDGKPCTEQGCNGVSVVKGLCQIHYSRVLYNTRKKKVCLHPGCEFAFWAKGFCKKHWDMTRVGHEVTIKPRVKKLNEGTSMSIGMEEMKDVLTCGDISKICNVAARTVSKWIDSGILSGYRIPGSRDRRVTKDELVKFMIANKLPMHVISKRQVLIFGIPTANSDIIQKFIESELGVSVILANDPFVAGTLMGEKKPTVVFVDTSNPAKIMPMLKVLDLSTAEVVVATEDAADLAGLNVNFLQKPYRIKDAIDIIAKNI